MNLKLLINEKLEEWVLVGSLMLIVLLVIGQVVTRFTLNIPMGWSMELSKYLFVWISWVSVSFAIHHNSHIRVELLKDQLPNKIKKWVELLVLLIFFVFGLTFLILGTTFITSIQASEKSPSIGIPMWIVYLVIPIVGLLICIRLVQQFIYIIRQ